MIPENAACEIENKQCHYLENSVGQTFTRQRE